MRPGSARSAAVALIFLAGAAALGGGAAAQDAPAPRVLPAGELIVNLDDLARPLLIENQIETLARVPDDELAVTVPNGQARLGDFTIPSGRSVEGHLLVLRGDAEIRGRLGGNLVVADGDAVVHPGAVVTGDVLALRGTVRELGGEIGGETRSLSAPLGGVTSPGREAAEAPGVPQRILRSLAGVVGVLVSLLVLGFLLALFGRSNVEIVAETVLHSFGRAFVTGLLGQLLLVPTFGMLVVGLVLSVVGVLLLPFAVAVFVLLAIVGIVGGFLAVASAMGETYTRRRMAQGVRVDPPGQFRYMTVGLAAAAALWIAWAVLGWVPVAGALMLAAAVLLTWLMATVGFGAALLSRAGIRENFAGRIVPPEALTDEYLWATPQFGVPAVRRPGTRTPPPFE